MADSPFWRPLCGLLLSFFVFGCASPYRGVGDFSSPLQGPQPPTRNYLQEPFSLIWPVEKVRITGRFGDRRGRPHHGVDLDGHRGTEIYSAHPGVVVYAGNGFRGYGNMVLVEYDNDWATLYAHLNSVKVREGESVEQGQMIGTMGRTGRATGVHLHFEVLKNKQPVDPMRFLTPTGTIVHTANEIAP